MPSTVQRQYKGTPIGVTKVAVTTGYTTLVGWNLINPDSTNAYLKMYNGLDPNVVIGTTAPLRNLLIPAKGTTFLSNEDKFQLLFNIGLVIIVTTTFSDSGAQAAPSTGCYVEILYNTDAAN